MDFFLTVVVAVGVFKGMEMYNKSDTKKAIDKWSEQKVIEYSHKYLAYKADKVKEKSKSYNQKLKEVEKKVANEMQ